MIVVGCEVKCRNFSLLGLVGRVLEFLYEVPDNLQMTVLNSSKKGRIAFLVLGGVAHPDNFKEMPDDIQISSGNGKMKRHFALGFFDSIEQIVKRGELLKDGRLLVGYLLFEVDQEELELPNFKGGDSIADFLVEFGYLLVFL